MATVHFNQTTKSTPEQFTAGLTRARAASGNARTTTGLIPTASLRSRRPSAAIGRPSSSTTGCSRRACDEPRRRRTGSCSCSGCSAAERDSDLGTERQPTGAIAIHPTNLSSHDDRCHHVLPATTGRPAQSLADAQPLRVTGHGTGGGGGATYQRPVMVRDDRARRAASMSAAAWISARWVNACGKLPSIPVAANSSP